MAAILVATLSACSTAQEINYDDVSITPGIADVDSESSRVGLPLDSYLESITQTRLVMYAEDLQISECMSETGETFEPIDRRKLGTEGDEVLTFGLISPARAAEYGYGEPAPSALYQQLLDGNTVAQTDSWQNAFDACLRELRESEDEDQSSSDLAERGRNGALGAAQVTDEWIAAKQEWQECLTGASGVEFTEDDEGLTGFFPDGVQDLPEEQQIRVGLSDVACKESLGTVQTLADIWGSYEQKFIDANEGALKTDAEDRDDRVQAAEAIIATPRG